MQEEATQGVTIQRCINCRIIVTALGIRWCCDDWHPEVFAWLEAQQEHATTPGDTDSEQQHQRKRLQPYRK